MGCQFFLLQSWRFSLPPPPPPPVHSWRRRASNSMVLCFSNMPVLRQPNPPKIFVASSFTVFTQASSLPPPSLPQYEGFKEELHKLLGILPMHIKQSLESHPELLHLVEIVMDLGRPPLARFPSGDFPLSQNVISISDLDQAVALVGDFGDDNRAGIDRTLHRISAIRNRAGRIVGLTCRVGRAICGSAEMVRDLVASGGSLLLMGSPGVGKTTAIREISRILADEYYRRVVIVDTSNEIAGDGDIPHSGIGRARRMQVPNVRMQHEVMIEAVENHMPQCIVIDEIGTELEASAARTIAERGVQLVGTAHGMTVENLIKNPLLQNLAGGIQSVTLGDDEARRRGVQKSVLERKSSPTFIAAAEMISRTEWRIHRNLAATVDALLSGQTPQFEVRRMREDGQVLIGNSFNGMETFFQNSNSKWTSVNGEDASIDNDEDDSDVNKGANADTDDDDDGDDDDEDDDEYDLKQKIDQRISHDTDVPILLYTYQITEANLDQVMEVMGLENALQLTDDITAADAILALRSKFKQNSWVREIAKLRQLPIFVIKANTMAQIVRAFRTILGMETLGTSTVVSSYRIKGTRNLKAEVNAGQEITTRKTTAEDEIDALEEARLAIEQIVIPRGQAVELLPRPASIINLQIQLIESYHLITEKAGTEENCRLRILPVHSNGNLIENSVVRAEYSEDNSSEASGVSGTSVDRLPILPE